jgi:glycosyltransferase involved in cell wall biosynthesis
MFSIIIPAYNESAVIERCLRAMLEDYQPGEFEIIVVPNGCKDDTADKARAFGEPVKVVETPVGSKIGALNLGDQHATGYPRMYIDADIVVSTAALRDIAGMLGDDSPILVAAPQAVVAFDDRSPLVRSFCKVWTSLPYFTEGMIGSGFYAFSKRGRERFDEFPDIIADDGFARLVAAPHERKTSARSKFTISPPTTLRAIANVMVRVRAGNYELRQKFPEMFRHETTGSGRSLRVIATQPHLWLHAPVYLGVMFYSKLRAHRKLQMRREKLWERDETARQG